MFWRSVTQVRCGNGLDFGPAASINLPPNTSQLRRPVNDMCNASTEPIHCVDTAFDLLYNDG